MAAVKQVFFESDKPYTCSESTVIECFDVPSVFGQLDPGEEQVVSGFSLEGIHIVMSIYLCQLDDDEDEDEQDRRYLLRFRHSANLGCLCLSSFRFQVQIFLWDEANARFSESALRKYNSKLIGFSELKQLPERKKNFYLMQAQIPHEDMDMSSRHLKSAKTCFSHFFATKFYFLCVY
jgi:hypothetical protein